MKAMAELGLSGEVRHVPQIEKRLAEAQKMGFEVAIGPKNREGRDAKKTGAKSSILHGVGSVREALNTFLEKD